MFAALAHTAATGFQNQRPSQKRRTGVSDPHTPAGLKKQSDALLAVQAGIGLLRQYQSTQNAGPAFELWRDHILVNVAHDLRRADISIQQSHKFLANSTEEMRLPQHTAAQQN